MLYDCVKGAEYILTAYDGTIEGWVLDEDGNIPQDGTYGNDSNACNLRLHWNGNEFAEDGVYDYFRDIMVICKQMGVWNDYHFVLSFYKQYVLHGERVIVRAKAVQQLKQLLTAEDIDAMSPSEINGLLDYIETTIELD